MNLHKLSVIIPFLNEGTEVETTLQEIRRTAGDNVDIILINDASYDGFDYRKVTEQYNVDYIEHKNRLGNGVAIQTGIEACKTPYFLILDAHMRFYDSNWAQRIVECIEANPHAVYCCRCKVWYADDKKESDKEPYYGAYLDIFSKTGRGILAIPWIKKDLEPDKVIVDIPCVLGACYAATKEYWNYLRGYEGLTYFGGEEQFISLKAWQEGGGCKLIKDVVIGHLFRKAFPYNVAYDEDLINKIFIADTVLPYSLRSRVMSMARAINYIAYCDYQNRYIDDSAKEEKARLKEYLHGIFQPNGFDKFMEINNKAAEAMKDVL